jgi:hypothetical protein
MDLGFGKLVKVEKKKRGWGPCKVDFVEGGEKLVILRLAGKEMATPFLTQSISKKVLSVTVPSPAGSVTFAPVTPKDAKKEAKALKLNFVQLLPEVPKSAARNLAMQSGKPAAEALWYKDYFTAVQHLLIAIAFCEGKPPPAAASSPEPAPAPAGGAAAGVALGLVATKPTRPAPLPLALQPGDASNDQDSPVEKRGKFEFDEESENPLHGDEMVHGLVDRHHQQTATDAASTQQADDDDAENPLFGDEEAHSVVERVHANTPRQMYFEADPERDATDTKLWTVLQTRSWGSQLSTLRGKGWVEPDPAYTDLESQLGRRVYVMEHGFGRLAKVERTKRGFKPSTIAFVDGGRKSIVLRAAGKEMATPWLISPAVEPISAYNDLLESFSTPSKKSSSVKTVDVPATPEQDQADRHQWSSLQSLGGWGKQLSALASEGWVEVAPDYNTIDQHLGERLFVMDLGFGKLVKVEKKKRGWGPCKVDFVEGGEKLVILRLAGKEMATPFLIEPAESTTVGKLNLSPSDVSEGVPPARVPVPAPAPEPEPAPVGGDYSDSADSIAMRLRAEVSLLYQLPPLPNAST